MWLVAVLKDLWPLLSVIASGGIIPFCIWWGRRLTERDKRRDLHEERRTRAAEDIPQALRDLKDQLAATTRAEGLATREAIEDVREELLEAIRENEIREVKDLIKERLSDTPSSPRPPTLALKGHRP